MKKNYFELTNNYRNNAEELAELSTIYTMSTLKRLLGKQYTPFIDALRRTWTQNHRADLMPNIWEQVAQAEQERAEHRAEYESARECLKDITLTDEERADLDAVYFAELGEVQTLTEQLADLKTARVETYSDLKDLCQVFTLAYMSADPTADEYRATLGRLLGADDPTARQLENREQWAHMNGRQKRGALEHVARIKHGQRAVNRYIRAQANKTADYNTKLTSYEVALENGAKVRALTRNTYAESLGDVARVRNLAKNANLSANQSRFIEHFTSKQARQAEQNARTKYHAEQFDKMTARGEIGLFEKRINERGYRARVQYAMNKIGIMTPQAQAKLLNRIREKLADEYRGIIAQSTAEPQANKTAPKRQNKRVNGVAWVEHTEQPQKTYRPMTEEERAELFQSEPKQSNRRQYNITADTNKVYWFEKVQAQAEPPRQSAPNIGRPAPSTEPTDTSAWTKTRVKLNTTTSADLERAKASGQYTMLPYEPPTR